MALQTSGQIHVAMDRTAIFQTARNPVWLAQCIPGCKDVRELSEGRYSAVLTNEVGFITLSFKVIVEIVKIDPPRLIEAKITGDAIGLVGRVQATAGLELSEAGPNETEIRHSSNVSLTGRLGGLGEPVFRAKSAEVAKQFGTNLKAAIDRIPTEAQK